MNIERIEKALMKLGDFALVSTDDMVGFQLYNPFVEGDAICIPFATLESVILYLEKRT